MTSSLCTVLLSIAPCVSLWVQNEAIIVILVHIAVHSLRICYDMVGALTNVTCKQIEPGREKTCLITMCDQRRLKLASRNAWIREMYLWITDGALSSETLKIWTLAFLSNP